MSNQTIVEMLPTTVEALRFLYETTGGPNWTRNDNWLNGGSPCDDAAPWFGVNCTLPEELALAPSMPPPFPPAPPLPPSLPDSSSQEDLIMYAWLVMGVSTSLFFLLSLSAFVRYFAGLECDGQKPRGQSTATFRLLGTGTLISAASALASLATWRVMQLRAVDESIGFFRLVGMLCLGMSATGLWAMILRRSSTWCARCVADVFGRTNLSARRGAIIPTLMVCVGLISFSALLGTRFALHETSEQLLAALLDLGMALAGLALSCVFLLLAAPHASPQYVPKRRERRERRWYEDDAPDYGDELSKPLSVDLVSCARIVAALCGVGAIGVLLAWSILQVASIDDTRE